MLVLESHLHAKQALRAFGVQHIFVVGLRRRQDRRELMERQLRVLHFQNDTAATFVDAVDGSDKNVTCFSGRATKLGGGNRAACGKQSWAKAVQMAVERGPTAFPALITEDDLDFGVRWPPQRLPVPPRNAQLLLLATKGCSSNFTDTSAPQYEATLLPDTHPRNTTRHRRSSPRLGGNGAFWGSAAAVLPSLEAARALRRHLISRSVKVCAHAVAVLAPRNLTSIAPLAHGRRSRCGTLTPT